MRNKRSNGKYNFLAVSTLFFLVCGYDVGNAAWCQERQEGQEGQKGQEEVKEVVSFSF